MEENRVSGGVVASETLLRLLPPTENGVVKKQQHIHPHNGRCGQEGRLLVSVGGKKNSRCCDDDDNRKCYFTRRHFQPKKRSQINGLFGIVIIP